MPLTPEAFHGLYADYGPAVRARCRAMCRDHAEADEALQEAFLKAWRARDRFDGRNPLGWLQTIARNVCLDRLRKQRPWAVEPEVYLQVPAPRLVHEDRIDAEELLGRFSAEDAAMLRLRHVENWRIHEIAEHFDTSQRSVRRRLERIEKRARALLAPPPEVRHAR